MSIRITSEITRSISPAFFRILATVCIVGVAGFLGGVITSYGPKYIHLHLTQEFISVERKASIVPIPAKKVLSSPPPIVSEILEEKSKEVPPSLGQALLVVHSEKNIYALLESEVDRTLGRGSIKVEGDPSKSTQFTKTQAIGSYDSFSDWKKMPLHLYSAKGAICKTEIESLVLLGQLGADVVSLDELSNDWIGSVSLAAKLKVIRGDCGEALWARDSGELHPAVAVVGKVSKQRKREARRLFRKSESWKKHQDQYKIEGGQGLWDQVEGDNIHFQSIHSAEEAWIFVGASGLACGEYAGQLGILYPIGANGRLHEAGAIEMATTVLGIDAAADTDLDGDLDFFTYGDGLDKAFFVHNGQKGEMIQDVEHLVSIEYCRC